MKLGKKINGEIEIIEAEGEAIDKAINNGYKPICESEAPSDASNCEYVDGGKCFVQEWKADNSVSEGDADSDVEADVALKEIAEIYE